MHTVAVLLVAVVAVAAATWTFRDPCTLAPQPGRRAASSAGRSLSVIVPARNEAANLPALLMSLTSSDAVPAEIIVVDDGSTDQTASVAAEHGASVVAAPPLPSGWVGKSWACHIGAEHARSPLLMFLDADARLAPGAVHALLARHATLPGLVSVQPFHAVERPYEHLSAAFNLVSVMGSGAFGARSAGSGARVAFGPCLVTSAEAYRRAGGHEAVRAEIVEDIALAERYIATGQRVTCVLGGEVVSFRMYPHGLRSLVEGWTKNIAAGAGRAPVAFVVPAVMWVVATAAIWTSLLIGLGGWVAGGRVPVWPLVGWAVVTAQLWTMLRRIGTFGRATALLFVVPLACFLLVFARSALLVLLRRPVRWHDRLVPSAGSR